MWETGLYSPRSLPDHAIRAVPETPDSGKAVAAMTFLTEIDPVTGLMDAQAAKDKGRDLHDRYVSAQPFPHIAIDDFLPPALLERCLADFPASTDAEHTYNRDQERLKRSYLPEVLPSHTRQLFYTFNSRPFIQVVENISGIEGLIPDPYFVGGGFHEIAQGGHLSMHADFNHHTRMNLERRINVLIYLNEGWTDEYGGQLELWDDDMTRCVQSYVPLFNRCVVFNTTSTSNHGNPKPVRHPQGISRRSIALYYYTATWDGTKRQHTTQFKVRPGSSDARDIQVKKQERATKRRELATDLLPPLLYRGMRRIKRRISYR
jgi:Rps23 Pro-64 3,4-dihydroxylase Tpa1-like proline 4-hydroxylase